MTDDVQQPGGDSWREVRATLGRRPRSPSSPTTIVSQPRGHGLTKDQISHEMKEAMPSWFLAEIESTSSGDRLNERYGLTVADLVNYGTEDLPEESPLGQQIKQQLAQDEPLRALRDVATEAYVLEKRYWDMRMKKEVSPKQLKEIIGEVRDFCAAHLNMGRTEADDLLQQVDSELNRYRTDFGVNSRL